MTDAHRSEPASSWPENLLVAVVVAKERAGLILGFCLGFLERIGRRALRGRVGSAAGATARGAADETSMS